MHDVALGQLINQHIQLLKLFDLMFTTIYHLRFIFFILQLPNALLARRLYTLSKFTVIHFRFQFDNVVVFLIRVQLPNKCLEFLFKGLETFESILLECKSRFVDGEVIIVYSKYVLLLICFYHTQHQYDLQLLHSFTHLLFVLKRTLSFKAAFLCSQR